MLAPGVGAAQPGRRRASLSDVTSVLAHGNNLDEIAFVAVPLLIVALLVGGAWKRSRELEEADEG